MDQYQVDIRFPRDKHSDSVTISGLEEHVEEAKEHLLMLADDYVRRGWGSAPVCDDVNSRLGEVPSEDVYRVEDRARNWEWASSHHQLPLHSSKPPPRLNVSL